MNKDIHSLYNAYRSIHENVPAPQSSTAAVYDQATLIGMNMAQLNEILKNVQNTNAQLKQSLQKSINLQDIPII